MPVLALNFVEVFFPLPLEKSVPKYSLLNLPSLKRLLFFRYEQFTHGKAIKQLVLVWCITLLYIKLIFTSLHPKPQIM